jgi:glyoxylase-like metal-dependent hydrolase (beta-lactamase superfamily II)
LSNVIQDITPNIKLLNFCPPGSGFENFISSYLVYGKKKALVDVGPQVTIPGLLAALAAAEVSPGEIDYIILTHIHMDHAGGIGLAVKEMKNAQVLAHRRAYNHLVDPANLWQASQATLGNLALKYGKIDPVPADRIMLAEDGIKLDLGNGFNLEIYQTPGHAAHHIAVFDRKDDVLLAGDAAGIEMNCFLRPGAPPPFRLRDYLDSLDRMIALQPRKIGYAHFGCYDDAVARLQAVREQTLLWYKIAQIGVKENRTPEDIFRLILMEDDHKDKLEAMEKGVFQREYPLILNTVRGLMSAQ